MKRFPDLWITALLAMIAFNPAAAQEQEALNSGVFTLGDVIVTEQKEPPGSVSQVDEETLRRYNADDLAEALDLMPGVALSARGARNERTIHVRGFDVKHVPLFMDGIPIYVMYDGYSDLGRFTTFDISRIVVSKGAASVLYGPNTMGGAINVITKRPEKAFETNAGFGIASGDTTKAYANFGSNQGKWYMQGGFSYVDRDYFNLSDDFEETASEDGDKRENSYFTDKRVGFKVGYQPSPMDEYASAMPSRKPKRAPRPIPVTILPRRSDTGAGLSGTRKVSILTPERVWRHKAISKPGYITISMKILCSAMMTIRIPPRTAGPHSKAGTMTIPSVPRLKSVRHACPETT